MQTDADTVKVTWRELPIDHPLVQHHMATSHTGVMLHIDDRRGRGCHYVVRKDDGGWYIRRGKRGQTKSYLDRASVTYINGEIGVMQFRIRR